jgi:hypothetical protein
MANSTLKAWKIWSNILGIFGAGGCLIVFLWLFGLIGYYSFNRPQRVIPERSWTEPLHWTHGYYGTHEENEQLFQLHDWFFPFMVLAGVGGWIKFHGEKNERPRTK